MKRNLICFCKEVTEAEIVKVVKRNNIRSVDDVVLATGASTGCGRCRKQVEEIYRKYKSEKPDQQLRLF